MPSRQACLGAREQCQKHCVLGATAKERPLALHVMAPAKSSSEILDHMTVKNVAELANAPAMFVVARAKLSPLPKREVEQTHS